MAEDTESRAAFAATLQTAYHEVRLHSPQGVDDVEARLRSKLEPNGVTLTEDILRALAFAIVNGRSF